VLFLRACGCAPWPGLMMPPPPSPAQSSVAPAAVAGSSHLSILCPGRSSPPPWGQGQGQQGQQGQGSSRASNLSLASCRVQRTVVARWPHLGACTSTSKAAPRPLPLPPPPLHLQEQHGQGQGQEQEQGGVPFVPFTAHNPSRAPPQALEGCRQWRRARGSSWLRCGKGCGSSASRARGS
jgi:hypothetical protein